MQTGQKANIIIIGGGLAGLVNAILLSRAGLDVLLIEKKHYPFHKVCGEYISNEVLPFLKSIGVDPLSLDASQISYLQITSPFGKALELPLDLGGFGISRYTFDYHLYQLALTFGANCLLGKGAEEVTFQKDGFTVQLSDGSSYQAELVIGAFGKRSKMDQQLNRSFIHQRSPYLGVKYHIQTDFSKNVIALHNFKDGYCGVCAIENDKYNLCYLTTRDNLKKYGSIEEMESQTLYKNPHMKLIRQNAVFLYDKPEVINEISFAPKKAVENHVLMSGDTAGLITPLCGNGMAMAIHSAKILSDLIITYHRNKWSREKLEKAYEKNWNNIFSKRIWVGRKLQHLFGNERLSDIVVGGLKFSKPLTHFLVKQTHGQVF